MSVSWDVQEFIHQQLIGLSADQREDWRQQTIARLERLGLYFFEFGSFRDRDREVFEEAVEVLIRINGLEEGRGPFWRATKRITVARYFLRVWPKHQRTDREI